MHKVVANVCYGGFSLSLKAVEWLETNCEDNELYKFIKVTRNKILPSLSNIILCSDVSDWFADKRHHKDLVAVVEALGKDANGSCANLCVVKIYGNQYRIEDYDGTEKVVTPEDGGSWIVID